MIAPPLAAPSCWVFVGDDIFDLLRRNPEREWGVSPTRSWLFVSSLVSAETDSLHSVTLSVSTAKSSIGGAVYSFFFLADLVFFSFSVRPVIVCDLGEYRLFGSSPFRSFCVPYSRSFKFLAIFLSKRGGPPQSHLHLTLDETRAILGSSIMLNILWPICTLWRKVGLKLMIPIWRR